MKKVNIVFVFFCLTNFCAGQEYASKKDSVEITLSFPKNKLNDCRMPVFVNESFYYTYSLSKDTLRIKIHPLIDTLFVKGSTFFYFDYISTKERTQVMKIPLGNLENTRYLLIDFNIEKTYLFAKKRKDKDYFFLKCIY